MVLVANHPIGSLDGPVLLRAVAAVRPDVKVVASQLLTYIEPLRNLFVPVDNVAYKTSRKQIEGMQQQLDNQGALILFPAGEVSRMSPKGIRDGHWHTGFLRTAAKARAPIVPIHISARNSNLFYFTSLIYRPLSTLLLVREMFQQRAGASRSASAAACRSPTGMTVTPAPRIWRSVFAAMCIARPEQTGAVRQRIADRAAGRAFGAEKGAGELRTVGVTPDGKTIYLYRRHDEARTPILRELGRLREIAFRAVGEGSGRRRDLDSYDDDYYHGAVG